jgi:hypothetical protein
MEMDLQSLQHCAIEIDGDRETSGRRVAALFVSGAVVR